MRRWVMVALLAASLGSPPSASAQAKDALGGLVLNPAMVKGPPTAPVTIVEFSDYQ